MQVLQPLLESIPIGASVGVSWRLLNYPRFSLGTERNIGTGLGAVCIVPPAAMIAMNPKWE